MGETGWILITGFALVIVVLYQLLNVLREISLKLTDLEDRVYRATGGPDTTFNRVPE